MTIIKPGLGKISQTEHENWKKSASALFENVFPPRGNDNR